MSHYIDKVKVTSKKRDVEFDQGKHSRAKLGFILMSTDLASESDFFNMAPKDVGIHITRLKTDDYTTNETLSKHIDFMSDAASRIQPDAKPNVISYSCTSGSIIIGEEKVMKEINKKLGGKVVTKISKEKNYCKAEEYHQKYFEKRSKK